MEECSSSSGSRMSELQILYQEIDNSLFSLPTREQDDEDVQFDSKQPFKTLFLPALCSSFR